MKNLYVVALVLLFSQAIYAQENWDLERCIGYAIEHSLDVRQSDFGVQDAGIVLKQNQQQQYPSISGSVGASSNFGRSIDPTTNEFITSNFLSNTFGLNLNLLLYNGGRLKNQINQSKYDKSALESDKQSMIATVTVNVVNAYFEALLARDNYTNADIQIKTIQDQIDQMTKLVAAGSRARFELYDLEAQLATSEQQRTLAQNRIDLAMLNLKAVMNLDADQEMVLEVPPLNQLTYTDLDNTSFETIYENVIKTRPEVEALDLRIKSGEVGIDIAKSSFYPVINLGGFLNSNYSNQARRPDAFVESISDPQGVLINSQPSEIQFFQLSPTSLSQIPYFSQIDENFFYGVGVQANIPIYNNYQAKGNTERAKINLENLRTDKERYIIDIRNLIGQLVTDAKAAKRNLAASDKVLEARQIAFDNAQKRFELGAINSFDYISIQDQLNTAKTDQILAKYDYMLKIKVLDFYQGYPVTIK